MKKRLGAAIAAVSALSIMLAGCGSTELPGSGQAKPGGETTSTAEALPTIEPDPALLAKLPKTVQDSKKIRVGVDATYKPNEYLDADGKTVIGMNVDLFDAIAQRLGVTNDWQNSPFDAILLGIESRKYDAGSSSFTINEKRLKNITFVSYLEAGSLWVTPTGNPKNVDPQNVCGQTVAIQTGTVQDDEMKAANENCPPDNKIDVLSFADQGEVTNAVTSGRAAGMIADSPISLWAVNQSDGKLESLGEVYDSAPYGFAFNKADDDFAEAVAAAANYIREIGVYDKILANYGQEKSAIATIEVVR